MSHPKGKLTLLVTIFFLFLAGCSSYPQTQPATLSVTSIPPTQAIRPSATLVPTDTPTPAMFQSVTPTPRIMISSPLEGIPIADLPGIISNPFQQPHPGKDDGHHGTDFAFYRYGEQASIEGWAIQAVFPGQVAAVIENRPPYGNALIIETSFSAFPLGLRQLANQHLPDMGPTPVTPLTCPSAQIAPIEQTHNGSMYILYAHLQQAPKYTVGDMVQSNEVIGNVGNTGASGNPHLHLETRFGPSEARFDGMAHYTDSATNIEMANYCAWRISGRFQMIDPMKVLLLDLN